jgi:outer membrane autotransporter protein
MIIWSSTDKLKKHYKGKKMKAIALAALALSALATPALAGPYVESKHEFKGTDEDFSKAVHQGRVGYEWKTGNFKPYVEGGLGVTSPDGGENQTFTALEVGSKVKITDKFSAYGKWENIFQEDSTRDWKVEVGTKYKF